MPENKTWTAKVGPHIGVLIRFVTYSVVAIVFFAAGLLYFLVEVQGKSNQLLHDDSIAGHEITQETIGLKNEIDEFLKHNDPILADGTPNPKWIRLLERQRAIARQRGDQTSLIRKASNMFENISNQFTWGD